MAGFVSRSHRRSHDGGDFFGPKSKSERMLGAAPDNELYHYGLAQESFSLLKDSENDAHLGLGVLPGEDRSNVECRQTCIFNSSEMSFNTVTADWYPVRPLSHEVKNINQACLVVDQPSMALQAIH